MVKTRPILDASQFDLPTPKKPRKRQPRQSPSKPVKVENQWSNHSSHNLNLHSNRPFRPRRARNPDQPSVLICAVLWPPPPRMAGNALDFTAQQSVVGQHSVFVLAGDGFAPEVAARALQNETAGGDVPDPDAGFQVSVETSAGHVSQRQAPPNRSSAF